MLRKSASLLLVLLAVALMVESSAAQGPSTGTPAFGSFGGGPFDVINLGNLNVHFAIPIVHKAGRGLPFNYDLTYDSSVWYPASVNGPMTWVPTSNSYWGWRGLGGANIGGSLTYSITYSFGNCGQSGQYTYQVWQFKNLVYSDNQGSHNVTTSFQPQWFYVNGGINELNCPNNGPQPPTMAAIPFLDGSGLMLHAIVASSSSISYNVTNMGGVSFSNSGPVFQTQTDPNGNQIFASSNGSVTDTLGQTALTVSGAAPSNTTLSYIPPSGESTMTASAVYTVSYRTYTVQTNFGCPNINEYPPSSQSLVDKVTLPDGTHYQFQYEPMAGGSSGQVTGRLSSVTLPTGGAITYTYGTTNGGANNAINCSDGSVAVSAGSTPSLTRVVNPGGTWTYSRSQGSGNQWTTTVTDPSSNQTVITFQKDATSNTTNFFEAERQAYQRSTSGTLLSTIYTCYNTAGPTPSNCPTTSVSTPISRVTVFSCLPALSGQESETDTQYNQYSDPGYPNEVDSYDFGSGQVGALLRKVLTNYNSYGGAGAVRPTSVQVQNGSGTVVASTQYSYDQTPLQSPGGTTPQWTNVGTARGNLTTIQQQVTGGGSPTYLYKVLSYYNTGTPYQTSDWGTTSTGGSNLTTYNYSTQTQGNSTQSCGNSFVTSVSEPLSLSRSFGWDCVGGVQTSATDENGAVNAAAYSDASFWRPASSTDPLNYVTTFSYPSNTVVESALLFNNGNSVVDKRILTDGFGRPLLMETKEGPNSANYDTVFTAYNSLGQLWFTTLPYVGTVDQVNWSAPSINNAYDALGRITSRVYVPATGGTTITYAKNDVYQDLGPAPSGENDKRKQLEYDGLGRLTSVCEISSASGSGSCGQTNSQTGFWTKYTYDLLGDLTGVTQNAQAASGSQQTRTYTFDMIGRLTSETNPESGTTTYVYDSLAQTGNCAFVSPGDLLLKVDAAGNGTCFTYDNLHRVLSIGQAYNNSPNASATPDKCFVYDSATVNSVTMSNTKDRLAEAYTVAQGAGCAAAKITDEGFSYTARGEVANVYEKTPDSGGYYHVNATYWAHGRLNQLNGGSNPLPGLPTISYGGGTGSGMDPKGRITSVTATSGQNPASSIAWNSGDQVTGVTFGSGDGDSYQYDPNTGRMTQYKLNVGSYSQTGALTWNANATLQKLQITDTLNSADTQTCTNTYDDLMRLVSNNCGSVWSQTFGFDPFGNLSKSGSAQFLPTYTGTSGTGAPTNQYYQIPGGASGTSNYYDANGNLKNDLTHTYTWDADGNMTSVDGSTVTMTYDAFDRMAEQTRSSGHTEIAYGPYGMKLALMNGQSLVSAFVKIPGGGRAVYTSTGLTYYRHADHLGSSRLATKTTQGARWYQSAYAPYGEDYAHAGDHPDLAFTDENQDTVAGGFGANLYDFMLREYRTGQGRWTSPDPAGLGAVDPTNPQSWNRYAYVLNNPLGMVDLLGDDGCYFGNDSSGAINDSTMCAALGGDWQVDGSLNTNICPDCMFNSNTKPGCAAGCGPDPSPASYSCSAPNCNYTIPTVNAPVIVTGNGQGGGSSGIVINGVVFFKMKNKPIDSGPLNKNFQQPEEENPIQAILDEIEENASKVGDVTEVLLDLVKNLSSIVRTPAVIANPCGSGSSFNMYSGTCSGPNP